MIKLPIRNTDGQEVGTYEFDPADLAPRISKQLLHDVVVMYEANRRQGTVKTKSRGEVAGSTRKLFRQKGTGRARMGPIRTPIRRGGGHAFAKRPKDWSYRLPKKAIKLATRMALLSKFQDGQAVVIDSLSVEGPKTRVIVGILKNLGLDATSCLLALEEPNVNIWLSSRNISNLWVSPTRELNAYDLLHQRHLLITRSALDGLRNAASAAAAE